jgi:DNA polymerase-3 subunit epsilon/CBS domain-containing protein
VLGSAGRGESLLAMDQDNAIVFAEGEPGSAADLWFARLGAIVADILHEVGVPYCKGGVMAKNGEWRGSLPTWRERVAGWIARSKSADLLSVDIFFDLVGVHGDTALAQTLWRDAFAAARGNAIFAKLLAEAAGEMPSGLTMLGGLRTENGRIDLKMVGLFGIVSTARVLAARGRGRAGQRPARPRGADARSGRVPRPHPRAAARRHSGRAAAEQQGRGQAAHRRTAQGIARGAAPVRSSRRAHARPAFLNGCRDLTLRLARGIDRIP